MTNTPATVSLGRSLTAESHNLAANAGRRDQVVHRACAQPLPPLGRRKRAGVSKRAHVSINLAMTARLR